MSEEEKSENSIKFYDELQDLLIKYKHMDAYEIVYLLMLAMKVESCASLRDYHAMLGLLTAMLTDGLKEIWDEIEEQSMKNKE